ncbi:hypothetical protein GO755_26380 [Spirosoma sp. HMF4905]|uniref:Uncharacterized protein n=1 Tax=Spirosoma arboris TaxID=2682092 RepID=A0A7K1SIJ1_9BACT|nr:hypothetical protein [Spirosoma arboris]MVM33593.1 hypothetical protein [Spirosoma arboris]
MNLCSLTCIGFLMALLAISNSYGCTCSIAVNRTIKESIESTPAVFTGTVLAESYADLGAGQMRAYLIKVKKIFKGNVRPDTVVVLTNLNEASCGIRFKVHSKIVVFSTANLKGDKPINEHRFFETNICTRSGLYKEAYSKQLSAAIRSQ